MATFLSLSAEIHEMIFDYAACQPNPLPCRFLMVSKEYYSRSIRSLYKFGNLRTDISKFRGLFGEVPTDLKRTITKITISASFGSRICAVVDEITEECPRLEYLGLSLRDAPPEAERFADTGFNVFPYIGEWRANKDVLPDSGGHLAVIADAARSVIRGSSWIASVASAADWYRRIMPHASNDRMPQDLYLEVLHVICNRGRIHRYRGHIAP